MKKCEMVMMTPEMAAKLLERNYEGQRNIRKRAVEKYASDMKRGAWNGDTSVIIVSAEGKLIDGQHRLMAVVKSEATVPMWLMTGADPEAFKLIDDNLRRTNADVIGGDNRNNRAALAALLCSIESYGMLFKTALSRRSFYMSRGDVISYEKAHSDEIAAAAKRSHKVREHLGRRCTNRVSGLVFVMLEREAPDLAQYIDEQLSMPMPSDECVASFKMQWLRKAAGRKMDDIEQFTMLAVLARCLWSGMAWPLKLYADAQIERIQRDYDETGRIVC